VEIVLIHLGSRLPRHLHAAVAQVEAITGRRPFVVGRWRAKKLVSAKIRRFRSVESLSEMGLRGFWRYSAERFLVLEAFMADQRLDRCLHIESDTLLYVDPAEYSDWLRKRYGEGIAACPLTEHEDTAAVLSVGGRAGLSAFNDAFLDLASVPPPDLLARFGGQMAHEMRMIRILRDAGLADALPTTLESANASGSAVVFDPGSYGQFVDGIPGRPGVPYAGEHHEVGRELIAGRCRVVWDSERHTPSVVDRQGESEVPLANLHIHSKRLERFLISNEAPEREGPQ
jgi:hypothetical protein